MTLNELRLYWNKAMQRREAHEAICEFLSMIAKRDCKMAFLVGEVIGGALGLPLYAQSKLWIAQNKYYDCPKSSNQYPKRLGSYAATYKWFFYKQCKNFKDLAEFLKEALKYIFREVVQFPFGFFSDFLVDQLITDEIVQMTWERFYNFEKKVLADSRKSRLRARSH